jgi:hypothetical protein
MAGIARRNSNIGSRSINVVGAPRKVITVSRVVPIIFSIAVFAPVLWMAMDRSQPFERIAGVVVPPDPAPGEYIHIEWQIRVLKSCLPSQQRNVSRSIVDSTGKIHRFEPTEGIYGTTTTPPPSVSRALQLPPDIPAGPARYEAIACFACNPFQHLVPVCINKPNLLFTVRSKDNAK